VEVVLFLISSNSIKTLNCGSNVTKQWRSRNILYSTELEIVKKLYNPIKYSQGTVYVAEYLFK